MVMLINVVCIGAIGAKPQSVYFMHEIFLYPFFTPGIAEISIER
jgi:hypothetical protein